MDKMTKTERIKAAIAGKETDRIPFSIWYHMPDVDQDPVALAEKTVYLAKEYDIDFIKMMPFGNYVAQDYGLSVQFYCTPDKPALERKWGIRDIEDWKRIKPLPACYGTYGKQLEFAQILSPMVENEFPFVQTIFSPLTTAKKLAGPRVMDDMRSHPELIHQALAAIMETTINFVKANLEAGVSGFFFATQTATSDLLTRKEHEEFGRKYDLPILEACNKGGWMNILHIHGANTYFKDLVDYPVNCINWHDRWVPPTMAEARKLTDKCFLGGLNERWLVKAGENDIPKHLAEAIKAYGSRKGIILTPGCVCELETPPINFYTVASAAKSL